MSQDKFWILFSKKLAQEATNEELIELEGLVREHPEWQYALQNLEDIWSLEPKRDNIEGNEAFSHHMEKFREKFPEEQILLKSSRGLFANKILAKWLIVAASSAAILLVIFFWGFNTSTGATSSTDEKPGLITDQNEISTEPGSRSRVQLPDGSLVWLNAGSKLVYKKEFGQNIREVELKGEGFFDVVKNKEKPFIIHTNTIDIKVLGTAFNVKAYPQDKTTETSLIRGSIEVSVKKRPNEKIILSPNEKLIVKNADVITTTVVNHSNVLKPEIAISQLKLDPKDSSIAETQWVENRLVFRNESFSDIATRLERWYDVNINIKDEELESLRLSGTFDNETIDQALQGLAFTKGFHYIIKGKQITIYK